MTCTSALVGDTGTTTCFSGVCARGVSLSEDDDDEDDELERRRLGSSAVKKKNRIKRGTNLARTSLDFIHQTVCKTIDKTYTTTCNKQN